MQHHGAPTRLLDWTSGSFAALYFAVRAFENKQDGAVWVLDPDNLPHRWRRETDERAPFTDADDPGGSREYMADPDRVFWPLDNPSEGGQFELTPLPFYPPELVPRVTAQRGCFTIHSYVKGELERLANSRKDSLRLAVIRIPARRKRSILADLRSAGVSEATLFPDLDGLSRELQMARGKCVYEK
jgi:hypothetical protein